MGDLEPVRPASTVVLLRENDGRVETLLLKRNKALRFAGGFWVFPGGAIDAADRAEAGDDLDRAARLAAAREAREEAGMIADPDAMVPLSHWTTPAVEKRRFATWFFAAPIADDCAVPSITARSTRRAGSGWRKPSGPTPPAGSSLCRRPTSPC